MKRDNKKYIEYLLRNLERLDYELTYGFKTFSLIRVLTCDELADFKDDIFLVKEWYKNMPIFEREILTLKYEKGHLIKEIATFTHYSESYIKEIISKQKKILLKTINKKTS